MSDTLDPFALFKSLADETRLRLTLLVAQEGELCVCELTTALDESQPKVSRHLAQLRSGGLLADRRQGQWVYYRLHPGLPDWVTTVLNTALPASGDWLKIATGRLQRMHNRPDRCAPYSRPALAEPAPTGR